MSHGVYNWSQSQQGYILSSFYIGYVLTHVPGGVIAERYGGKWTLSLGILSTAIFTILTPLAVELGMCIQFVWKMIYKIVKLFEDYLIMNSAKIRC